METDNQILSTVAAEAVDQDLIDEVDLAALGHGQALSRKFDLWSILALAFCVLGTWSTFAQVRTSVGWMDEKERHTSYNTQLIRPPFDVSCLCF